MKLIYNPFSFIQCVFHMNNQFVIWPKTPVRRRQQISRVMGRIVFSLFQAILRCISYLFFLKKPFNRKLIRLFYSDLFANWQKTWSAGEWEKKKEIINLIRNRNWIWIMKNSFAKKENLSNEKIPITHYWKEKTSKVFWYFNLFGTKKFDILNSIQRKKELQGVYVCQ